MAYCRLSSEPEPLMEDAYRNSRTFRRLFNFAFKKYLKRYDERYELVLSRKLCGVSSLSSSHLLFLQDETDYQNTELLHLSADGLYRPSLEAIYLHETIHALIRIPDLVSFQYPRGPVVEYTNIILKELNRLEPVRISYSSETYTTPARI